jgi:alkylated DNA repair dioxygenase AlkB
MHVRMLCLGRHWNGKTYQYQATRADLRRFAGAASCLIVSDSWRRRIGATVNMPIDPDLCILKYYDAEGRMGLHQDKDEGKASIEAGVPVVSVSLGDTAAISLGGSKRRGARHHDPARVRRCLRLRRSGAPLLSRRFTHCAPYRARPPSASLAA